MRASSLFLTCLLLCACPEEEERAPPIQCALKAEPSQVSMNSGDSRTVQVTGGTVFYPVTFKVEGDPTVTAEYGYGEPYQPSQGYLNETIRISCGDEGGEGTVMVSHSQPACSTPIPVQCNALPPTTTELPPSTLPPGTTDCTVDANGCLESGYDRCTLVPDQLVTDAASISVAGVIPAGVVGLAAIDVKLFTEPPYGYLSTEGAGAGASRSSGSDQISLSVYDQYRVFQDGDTVTATDGDVDVVLNVAMDDTNGTLDLSALVDGTEAGPFGASGLPPGPGQQVVIEIFRSRVCGAEFQ